MLRVVVGENVNFSSFAEAVMASQGVQVHLLQVRDIFSPAWQGLPGFRIAQQKPSALLYSAYLQISVARTLFFTIVFKRSMKVK